MTTLVIGAGLVGSQVARILVDEGERPVLLDAAAQPQAIAQIVDLDRVVLTEGDILRPLTIVKALRDHRITAVVHTAANPMLTLGAQRNPYAAIELNIMGTVNVLEAARTLGIGRVVVSSSNVLSHYLAGGEGAGALEKEEAFPRPTTFYAATKQAVESLGLNYARWCGLEFAGMRYGAVFGPWSGFGGGGPSNLVREAVRRALAGEQAVVPARAMEWVYSKDAALGTVLALRAKALDTGIFNITMAALSTPAELADAIVKAVPGAQVKIDTPADSAAAVPNVDHLSSPDKSSAVLGYQPQFNLIDGIQDLADWMRRYSSGSKIG